MSIKKALDELNEAVKDLTSLHVQTFSGSVAISENGAASYTDFKSAIANSHKEKKTIEIKNGNEADAPSTTVNVNAVLILETLIQFDGDSVNFVAKDGVTQELLQLHKDAIDSGLKSRLGLLELFQSLISK